MLITLGYVVKDDSDRYLAYTQQTGFHYTRSNTCSPYVFENEPRAKEAARVFNAYGVEVKPVFIEISE